VNKKLDDSEMGRSRNNSEKGAKKKPLEDAAGLSSHCKTTTTRKRTNSQEKDEVEGESDESSHVPRARGKGGGRQARGLTRLRNLHQKKY